MGRGYKDAGNNILVLHHHAGASLTAAPLRTIRRQRRALDIAAMGDGHHHVFALDQVFDIMFEFIFQDDRAARIGKPIANINQFIRQDLHAAGPRRQNFQIIGDTQLNFLRFLLQLLPLHTGQALQAQVQNRACLTLTQPGAFALNLPIWVIDQFQIRQNFPGGPGLRHQILTGRLRVRCTTDQLDHFINAHDRDHQTGQNMRPVPRLTQLIGCAALDHIFTEIDEGPDNVLQIQGFRLTVMDRQHVHAETGLQGRMLEQLRFDDFRLNAAFQFDHNAHTVTI